MKATKSKRLSHLTTALGVLVLAIAGYVFKDVAVEQWYIWQLGSDNEEQRKAAVEKLAEINSLRAVPHLLRMLGEHKEYSSDGTQVLFLPSINLGAVPSIPAFGALLRIDDALPRLVQEIRRRESEPMSAGSGELAIWRPLALHASLKVSAERGDASASSLLENLGMNSDRQGSGRQKYLAWSAQDVWVGGQRSLVFLFDPMNRSWPGLQPQTIVVVDEDFDLRYWTEVGGEPLFSSAKLEAKDDKAVLAITCRHRRRPRPNNIGIHRYLLSPSGLQRIGEVEWIRQDAERAESFRRILRRYALHKS